MVWRKTVFLALFSMIFTTGLVAFALPIAGTASADGIWAEHELADAPITGAATNTQPSAYQLYRLDSFVLGFLLNSAPLEGNGSLALSLPMPDGSYRTFNIWQRPVLDAATQAAHPNILAFAGEAADDSRVRIVLDYAPTGFNAMIDLTGEKTWMIDQHPNGTDDYVIAYRAGSTPRAATCLCSDHAAKDVKDVKNVPINAGEKSVPENCVGGDLRKMDLGIAVSELVTAQLGGQAGALAHVNTLVNRLNLVFERDLAVRFILVSGTATIYDAANPEPNAYPHEATALAGPSITDLSNSHANLNAALGANGYDVGFSLTLFNLGGAGGIRGSGLARTPSLCDNDRGFQVSSYSAHTINDSYVGLVIHEVGHQFSAQHTTSGITQNCAPTAGFTTGAAVETGSGSTIMSYAGICGSDNLQNDADLYFHGFSLQQMNNWIASQNCYEVCPPDGNTTPTVTANDCTVPLATPFTLDAIANDADGNPLTYTWEQVDVSPTPHVVTQPDDGFITLFRSYPPTTSPSRDFPSLPGVLSGVLPLGEKYPLVPRTLNFMVTVRDGANGACSHAMQVEVANAGPLTISLPSAGQVLQCAQSVTWDPAGTETLPGGGNVNILLSTDGGNTFPTTLDANVPNDGSQVVTLPNLSTTTARIRIEPASGCWWVLSEEFAIEPCPTDKLFATGNNTIDDTCGNGNSNENGVIDPGESGFLASIELSATTAPVSGITGTLAPTTPGVTVTSGAQPWPNLTPGTPAFNASPFTFAVPASHPCGTPVTFDLTLNTASGTCVVPVSFETGRPVTNVFSYTGPTVNVATGNSGSNIILPVSGLAGNVIDIDLLIDGASCDGSSPATGNGINYPAPGVIDLTLTSPGNTSVAVQNGVPGGNTSSGNSNICGTEYDDEAPGLPIPATINGNFINQNFFPNSPLSAFDGQNGNGNWTLNVTMSSNFGADANFGDRSVTAWGLRITTVVCDPPKETADLEVSKTAPATADIGVAFPYTLTVMNNGPDTATNVTLTDTLPTGLTPASVGPFALGTLTAGTSTTVTFMVTAAGPLRTIENCASVSSADVIDPTMANNTNCASTILVDALGDVSLSASGPAAVDCGESFAYTLIVSNLSPFIASNVVVTSTVPSSCVIALDATDPCAVVSAGEVVCTIPNVAINGSVQLDIDVMVAACCVAWTNESTLFLANDTNAANNAASVVTTQNADNIPPSFTALIPNTFALPCNPTAAQFPNPAIILSSATDDCGVSTSFFQNADSQTGCDFTRIISYTTVDICGNSFSATSEVTWTEDTAAPTFGLAIPATLDLGCNPTAADFPDNAAILASATDNCGIVNRSVTAITNGGPCVFSSTITYLVEDGCGLTATETTIVTWSEDLQPPSFGNCSPAAFNLGCNPAAADFPDPAVVLASAQDTCGVVSSWVESVRTTNDCDITMVQDFYAVDACGFTGTCQRTIQWIENSGAPTFPAAPAATLDLGCNPAAADFPDVAAVLASATDDCGITSSSSTVMTNGGPCAFSATYTWTAVNTCNMTSETVSVVDWREDLVAPTFSDCSPASTNLGCNPLPADFPDPSLVLASAFDACGVVTSWVDAVRNTNGCDITMVQDFYAVDACGFTGTCQRTIQWTESSAQSSFPLAPGPLLDLGCNPAAADFPDVVAILASANVACGISASSASAVTNGGPCVFDATLTWSAVDRCGVTVETVTVVNWIEDSDVPTFTDCSPAITNLGCNPLPGDFPDPAIVLGSASDSCGVVTSWIESVETTIDCDVTRVENFYAVDACGFTGTCQRTIQWTSSMEAPTFTAATPGVLDLGCNPATTDFPDADAILASATDDCGIVSSQSMVVTSGGPCQFSANYTWIAIGTCGLTGIVATVVNWTEDNAAPTFTDCSPAMTTLGCNPAASEFPDPAIVLASAVDNCGVVTSWVEAVRTTNLCEVSMVQTFYAVDACNQTGSCQRIIQWTESSQAPRFTAAPPALLDLGCNPDAADFPDIAAVLASASDDCIVASSDASVVTNGTACAMMATYTWTAVDSCGVTGTAVTVVNWIDDGDAPTIICPSSVSLGCNPAAADFPDPALTLATATDNCGVITSWVDVVRTTNDCDRIMERTFYAVDACSQTGSCVQTIAWTEDSAPPNLSCGPSGDLGCNPAAIPPAEATATDDCGPVAPVLVASQTTNGCQVTLVRVWNAIDACAQSASCTQTFTWTVDLLAPSLDCLDQTIPLVSGAALPGPATPTINDDCGATLTVITNTISTNILGDVDTEYVYLATDCGGRSDICRVTYAYDLPIDPPTIDCPPGAPELGCNPIIPSADAVLATATGECPIATADASDSITMDGCIATLTRVHTVVDTCGLATICTQVFTWTEDVEAPTFTCEPPLDLGCNPTTFPDAAVVLATAADNCGVVTSWFESVVGQADCQITETRTFYAVDGCGNTGSCVRVLQWIEDRTPPVLEGCPEETLIVVLPGELPQPPTISANDNCSTPSLSTEINPLSTNEFGVDVEYVYTAEDCAGAQTVCRVTFTYDYASLPAPTIDCNPDPVILTCGAGFRGRPSSASVLATAASACGIISNQVETTQMDTPCGSTLVRTYTVFDACGRSSVCTDSYTSNRQDFNPPILTVPADTSICSGGNIDPAFTGLATATDDCGITQITFVDTPLSNDCGTGIQRSWTAIDFCGNSASLDQLILVAENTLPAFDCGSGGFLEPVPPPATGFLIPDLTSQLLGDQACPVFVTQTPAADTIVTEATVVNVVVSNACGQSDRCQVTLSIPAGPQAIVGNEVWEDLNANGLRETGEPAVPGVTVLLLNANGSTAATTSTDAQGFYQFIIDFASSPPIARGANPSVSYLVAFNAPQYVATRGGGKSVILVGGNQSAPFEVASGDVIQDKDIGLVRPGSITGLVWQDLDNDNIPDDNLSELGVNGVTVELRRFENGASVTVGSTRTATNPQGEQGSYSFDNLLPGEYEIYVDMATLPQGSTLTPADGALRVTLASGAAITPDDLQSNFNFTPGPTAAVLLSFTSESGIATWHIGTEDQTLGYQLVDLATGLVVGDGFILATGGGEYRQSGLEPGQYALVEVDSDLARNTLGELTVYPEADADPTGEPTRLLEAGADGRLAFITESGINSYFVTGVASQAIVLDVTRPDSPVRLRVKTIVNEQGTALYFSWPAGASLQIR